MRVLCLFALLAGAAALAQTNPVPFVNQPLVPTATAPGGPQFTLTVNGTGFVSASVVNWNSTPLATTFVTSSRLTAIVPTANIASPGTATITVTNPAPGGGTSSPLYFGISNEVSNLVFSSMFTPPTGPTAAIVAADFNGDGKLDLAEINAPTALVLLLGNNDGTFQQAAQYVVSGSAQSLAAADFNGDGKMDIAVANGYDSTVSIFLGNGDGTFQSPKTFATGSLPIAVMTGDFNRDGKLDLALTCFGNGTAGSISILLGNGDGTFQTHSEYGPGVTFVDQAVLGDFNSDGKLDIMLQAESTYEVYLLLGNGDGTFQLSHNPIITSGPTSMLAADLNNDGNLDLILDGAVLLGNGDGTFQYPIKFSTGGSDPNELLAADFNGDGKIDLIVFNQNNGTGAPSAGISLGNGDGTFQPPTVLPVLAPFWGYTSNATTGDFNGDGQTDFTIIGLDVPYNIIFLQGSWPAAVSNPLTLSIYESVGASSPSQPAALISTGREIYDISSISLSGPSASEFSQTNNCGPTLPPNESCQFNVIFTPAAIGNRNATITVSGNYAPVNINLAGFGIGAVASISPTTVTFPGQYVGTSGLPQTVTLTNTGNIALTITSLTTSISDFGTLSNCTNTLQVGMNCTIGVFFDPTSSGNRAGTLLINSNAIGSPQVVPLMGAGQDFSMSAPSPSKTVSPGETATYSVTVIPNGGFNQVVQMSCSGAPPQSDCTVSPTAVALDGSGTQHVTVSVTTNPAAAGLTKWMSGPRWASLNVLWLAALCVLGLLSAVARPRRWVLGPALAMALCVGLGCGGGTPQAPAAGGATGGIEAGTYNLTVTGTFSSKSTVIARTAKLTLVVQ